jgi:hypothetical protein
VTFSFQATSFAEVYDLRETASGGDYILAALTGALSSYSINPNYTTAQIFVQTYLIPEGARQLVKAMNIDDDTGMVRGFLSSFLSGLLGGGLSNLKYFGKAISEAVKNIGKILKASLEAAIMAGLKSLLLNLLLNVRKKPARVLAAQFSGDKAQLAEFVDALLSAPLFRTKDAWGDEIDEYGNHYRASVWDLVTKMIFPPEDPLKELEKYLRTSLPTLSSEDKAEVSARASEWLNELKDELGLSGINIQDLVKDMMGRIEKLGGYGKQVFSYLWKLVHQPTKKSEKIATLLAIASFLANPSSRLFDFHLAKARIKLSEGKTNFKDASSKEEPSQTQKDLTKKFNSLPDAQKGEIEEAWHDQLGAESQDKDLPEKFLRFLDFRVNWTPQYLLNMLVHRAAQGDELAVRILKDILEDRTPSKQDLVEFTKNIVQDTVKAYKELPGIESRATKLRDTLNTMTGMPGEAGKPIKDILKEIPGLEKKLEEMGLAPDVRERLGKMTFGQLQKERDTIEKEKGKEAAAASSEGKVYALIDGMRLELHYIVYASGGLRTKLKDIIETKTGEQGKERRSTLTLRTLNFTHLIWSAIEFEKGLKTIEAEWPISSEQKPSTSPPKPIEPPKETTPPPSPRISPYGGELRKGMEIQIKGREGTWKVVGFELTTKLFNRNVFIEVSIEGPGGKRLSFTTRLDKPLEGITIIKEAPPSLPATPPPMTPPSPPPAPPVTPPLRTSLPSVPSVSMSKLPETTDELAVAYYETGITEALARKSRENGGIN